MWLEYFFDSGLSTINYLTDFLAKLVTVPTMFFGLGEHSSLQGMRQTGHGGMGRPGKIGPTISRWNPARHRSIAADHFGRESTTTHGGKLFAKFVFARINYIPDPPRAGTLAPEGELQRSAPTFQRGTSFDSYRCRSKMKWAKRYFWFWRGHGGVGGQR
jgi:hypothetical protein